MLIEAQAQKLLASMKITNGGGGEEHKEPSEADNEAEKQDSVKEESADVEMKEPEENNKTAEAPAENDYGDDKSIDIDPKTFCKLGHFHLLLEDYAKGKHRY